MFGTYLFCLSFAFVNFSSLFRSLGIILYKMCTNELPFKNQKEIEKKEFPLLKQEYECLNELLKS